ncbi:UNVERIFIED_CONTAM: proteasome regulatory particle base subunit, partial [Siphonaria sp. JEL0065]
MKAILLAVLYAALSVQAALTTKLIVLGRDGNQISSVSVTAPKTLAKPVIVSEHELLSLGIVSDSKNSKDEILFAYFVHTIEREVEASFAFESKGNGKYHLNLDFVKKNTYIYNKIKQHPGSYAFSILSQSEGTVNVGAVSFDFRSFEPVQVLGSTESFEPVKEIFHIFRQPEKMPNAVVSLFFAGAVVVVPWALLLVLWTGLKVNVKNLSVSRDNLIWGSAFLFALSASCAFFFVYWVQLNLFELFGYGSVVWSILAFLGRQALVSRADARLKAEKIVKGAAGSKPRNSKELFNLCHAMLRNAIECILCMVKRFPILKFMQSFSLETQRDLVIAIAILFNIIRQEFGADGFNDAPKEEEGVEDEGDGGGDVAHGFGNMEAEQLRDSIAMAMRDDYV